MDTQIFQRSQLPFAEPSLPEGKFDTQQRIQTLEELASIYLRSFPLLSTDERLLYIFRTTDLPIVRSS